MLTIDAMVLAGSTEPAEATLPLSRTAEWLLPLTGAAVAHLCLLIFILAAPRLEVARDGMPEVLPVTLYTTGELPTAVLPSNPADSQAAAAPVRSRQPVRPQKSNEPKKTAKVASSPPAAAKVPRAPEPRPASSQEVVHHEEGVSASAPVRPEEAGGAAARGASGDAAAGSAGAEATVVLARPRYRENPSPTYPESARRRQLEGTVVLEVLVSTEGKVGGLSISNSSGHQLLDEAALQAVRGWLFEPGRRGIVPLAMKILVPVRFGLR